jgi:hypothetical protein
MARTWLSIRVELVGGGREDDLWPRPGRELIARPGTTFRALARAIDLAFARWDLSHLHRFVLADGTMLMPSGDWDDLWDRELVDDASTKLSRLTHGEQFLYEFDFGDSWQHVCTVGPRKVDPAAEFGMLPDVPTVVFGWGTIPDQYGRRFADDDGEQPVPPQPDPPLSDLPPLVPWWGPARDQPDDAPRLPRARFGTITSGAFIPWVEEAVRLLRSALDARDDDAVLELLRAFEPMHVAHRCAGALLRLAERDDADVATLLDETLARLEQRGWLGDVELAEELDVRLDRQGAAAAVPDDEPLRPSPVDLDMVAAILAGPTDPDRMWMLDVVSGTLHAPSDTPTLAPEDAPGVTPEGAGAERVGILGLGFDVEHDDMLAVRSQTGVTAEADTTPTSRLLTDERYLGRARWWLAEAGVLPV